MSYQKELEFAKALALKSGKIMERYFRAEDIGTVKKADTTPLTVADIKINQLVIYEVKKAFPDHGVLGEEQSYKEERDLIWIVDPIDGTAPFSVGIPVSTFALALVDRSDGQPVVAVIYDPFLKDLYTATKGGGAFLNGQPIKTSDVKHIKEGFYSIYGPPIKDDKINYVPGMLVEQLRTMKAKNMSFASGIYTGAKVASGEFSAVLVGNFYPWDLVTLALLVSEAGGVVTDLYGKKRRYDVYDKSLIVAANKDIHKELLNMIKA